MLETRSREETDTLMTQGSHVNWSRWHGHDPLRARTHTLPPERRASVPRRSRRKVREQQPIIIGSLAVQMEGWPGLQAPALSSAAHLGSSSPPGVAPARFPAISHARRVCAPSPLCLPHSSVHRGHLSQGGRAAGPGAPALKAPTACGGCPMRSPLPGQAQRGSVPCLRPHSSSGAPPGACPQNAGQ